MPVNLLIPPLDTLLPVAGVRWGITKAHIRKPGRKDLAVMLLDSGASVSAVFTQNRFFDAPVQLCHEHLAQGYGSGRHLRPADSCCRLQSSTGADCSGRISPSHLLGGTGHRAHA